MFFDSENKENIYICALKIRKWAFLDGKCIEGDWGLLEGIVAVKCMGKVLRTEWRDCGSVMANSEWKDKSAKESKWEEVRVKERKSILSHIRDTQECAYCVH